MGEVTGTMLPSKPGELVYGMEGAVIRCPWHMLEFRLDTGACLFGTYPNKLQVYEASIRDGSIIVTMSARSRENAETTVGPMRQ